MCVHPNGTGWMYYERNTCARINNFIGQNVKMLSSGDEKFWDLKESAKWSLDVQERKRAIMQLAHAYGPNAVRPIAEIRDVAAYDEIRKACIEAMKVASKVRPSSSLARSRNKTRKARNRRKAGKAKGNTQ